MAIVPHDRSMAARLLPVSALGLLAVGFVAAALIWLPHAAADRREVLVPVAYAAVLLALAVVAWRGRLVLAWIGGSLLALLGVAGAIDDARALASGTALPATLPVAADAVLGVLCALFLVAAAVAAIRTTLSRPPRATPLTPIAWR
jgi:ABC-type Na+ efflux pump permease subunit